MRSGDPVEPANYPRLYLGSTRELQFSMLIGRFGAGIAAPPYVAFLATPETEAHAKRMLDTRPWMKRAAGERGEETLRLPVIETLGEQELPMLGKPVLE